MLPSGAVERPSVRELAWLFFRIGNTTFGSGSTIMVLLRREVTERRWVPEWQANLLFALSRVVPGTNVLAFVASVAHAARGWTGAVASLLAVSVPASFVIVGLTLAYQRWNETPRGGAFISGAMCSIVGVIFAASWLLAAPKVKRGTALRTLTLVLGGAALTLVFQPLTILAIAAAVGAFWPSSDEEPAP
jgi:chromate transporter